MPRIESCRYDIVESLDFDLLDSFDLDFVENFWDLEVWEVERDERICEERSNKSYL